MAMCSCFLHMTPAAAQTAVLVLLRKQRWHLISRLQAPPNSLKGYFSAEHERGLAWSGCRHSVMLHLQAICAVQAVSAGTSGTSEAEAHSSVGLPHDAAAEAPADRNSAPAEAAEPLQPTISEAAAATAALGSSESGPSSEGSEGEEADGFQEGAAAAGPPRSQVLSAADLELMQSMGLEG